MGFLTTITIYNDHLHDFEYDPKQFGKDILQGVEEAFYAGQSVTKNNIIVQPSRHADDNTLYLHWGNTVRTINPYSKEFEELITTNPELAMKKIKIAERLIKIAKQKIKESNELRNNKK